jgi:hypothetical protein
VLNMPHAGFLADWVLPFVPSIIGALSHSGGMLWERLAQEVGTADMAAAAESGAEEPTKELEAA